jgi:hypothetical protein
MGIIHTCAGQNIASRNGVFEALSLVRQEAMNPIGISGRPKKPSSPILTKGQPSTSPAGTAPNQESGGFAGLCVDCQNRHTCLYAKAAGGVWHCEEYA